MLSLIVAIAENNAIGKNGDLLCHLPNDLKHFKEITTGATVVMGKNTFFSLPRHPLPNRRNIVLTRDANFMYENTEVAHSIDEVYNMNMFATSGVLPDLTLYILVSPSVGLSRKTHQKELDRLELETNKFHETVYEGYLSLAKKYPDRVVVIDGEASKEEVLQATIEVIDKYLNK